jgi:VanZ family protein
MGAAIVLSAPYAQLAFTAISERWPDHSSTIILTAVVLPAIVAVVAALVHIRDGRIPRYALVGAGIAVGVVYYFTFDPIFTEAFHFAEYGILAMLFYRAWRHVSDWSILALPVLAGSTVGIADEWFQWFIPFRAGELNDVGLNALAAVGGLIFSAGVWPPRMFAMVRGSRGRLLRWLAATAAVLAAFFVTVHVGHVVRDSDIGGFRSRFSGAELLKAAEDRRSRWMSEPPVDIPRLSREDQYLAEGLWRVGRRNEHWADGNVALAWRENRILEKFYAPVLSTATAGEPNGHAWTPAHRAEAEARLPEGALPTPEDDYQYRLYTWDELL